MKYQSILLEVGGVYEVRNKVRYGMLGQDPTKRITKELPVANQYDFEDENGETYLKNGQFLSRMKTGKDLVKKVN